MKHILFVCLLALATTSFAQIAPKDSTMAFPAKLLFCRYALTIIPPSHSSYNVIVKACAHKTDTGEIIRPVLTQEEIGDIAGYITVKNEGEAADFAKIMTDTLLPYLAKRPYLAGRFMALRAYNLSMFMRKAAEGAAIIDERVKRMGW